MRTRLSVFLIALLLGWAAIVRAATFYVATTGNDANRGTAAAPFRTLQKGVRSLSAGDTLIVKGGTYPEALANIPSGRAGAPTTIQAAPGETVTLQPNNIKTDCVVSYRPGQSYVTIDGLILDAGSPDGTRLTAFAVCNEDAGKSDGSHHLIVKNSEIKNSRHSGMLIGGRAWEVRNNHIHHNGTHPTHDHGIYFEAQFSVITGNVLHDNACYNLQVYSSAGAHPTNNTITHNTFYNSGCGVTLSKGDYHRFEDNLIYNDASNPNGAALSGFGAGTQILRNVIMDNGAPGIVTIRTGNGDTGALVQENAVCGNRGDAISTLQATLRDNVTTDCAGRKAGAGAVPSASRAPAPLPVPRNQRAVTTPKVP